MKRLFLQLCWMHKPSYKFLAFVFLLLLSFTIQSFSQDQKFLITDSSFNELERIPLEDNGTWKFKMGNNPKWADPNLNTQDWEYKTPNQLNSELKDQDGRIEGWFRIKVKKEPDVSVDLSVFVQVAWQNLEIYVNGEMVKRIGTLDEKQANSHEANLNIFAGYQYEIPLTFNATDQDLVIAIHYIHEPLRFPYSLFENRSILPFVTEIGTNNSAALVTRDQDFSRNFQTVLVTTTSLLALLFWLLFGLNKEEVNLKYIAQLTTLYFLVQIPTFFISFTKTLYFPDFFILDLLEKLFIASILLATIFLIAKILTGNFPRPKWPFYLVAFLAFIDFSFTRFYPIVIFVFLFFLGSILYYTWKSRKSIKGAQWAIVGGTIISLAFMLFIFLLAILSVIPVSGFPATLAFLIFPLALLVYVAIRFKEILEETRQKAIELVKITKEKALQTEKQNVILESKVKERTLDLQKSLENLKSTQAQLIQSEKMASLGELTAGIAHEIQNPLNFVNNFSELNKELIEEANEELEKGDIEETKAILKDLGENSEKINLHGKRADAIVKGMLEHSRTNKGEKAPTDLNALVEEFVRLSYHGLRAKDKSFNADFKLELNPDLPKVNVVASEIGRVILNLVNNAFQACAGQPFKGLEPLEGFTPLVTVSTKNIGDKIEISVKDNGPGIPDSIKEKIFQPFFTTKPTGSGTGLGLSLSYDIVKAHGGELKFNSEIKSFSEFKITLPLS